MISAIITRCLHYINGSGSSLLSILICTMMGVGEVNAQFKEGLPWTVLPDSAFSEQDSAWIQRFQKFKEPLKVRWVYRVKFHITLTDTSGRMISAELPRNPGESEIVTWLSARYDTTYTSVVDGFGRDTTYRLECFGFESRTPSTRGGTSLSVSYFPRQTALGKDYSLGFFAMIQRAPSLYVVEKPPHTPDSIGFFIQYVDDIYHPAISPVREAYVTMSEPPFPNPCRDALNYIAPVDWARDVGEVIFFGPGGQIVHRSETRFGAGPRQLPAYVLATLPAGSYLLTLRNRSKTPGVAVAQVLKL